MTEPTRILYVDDEADIREIVQFALEEETDLHLKLCASGPEALAVADAYRPDLVLLDVMMPGMDGPTVLKHMRELASLADTPVAFVTAKVQPQEVALLMSLGAMEVIAKPFDPMSLPAQVRAISARSIGG